MLFDFRANGKLADDLVDSVCGGASRACEQCSLVGDDDREIFVPPEEVRRADDANHGKWNCHCVREIKGCREEYRGPQGCEAQAKAQRRANKARQRLLVRLKVLGSVSFDGVVNRHNAKVPRASWRFFGGSGAVERIMVRV